MPEVLVNVRIYNGGGGYPSVTSECPPSAAVLGNNLYIGLRGGTHCGFAIFDIAAANLIRVVGTPGDGYKAPSIAQFQGNMYVGFGGENTQLNLSSVQFLSSGSPEMTKLSTSAEGCDSWPTMFAATDGLMMAWQSKPGSLLNISEFIPAQTPDFLRGRTHYLRQYDVNTPPTMAALNDILYVAYSRHRATGDYLSVVVFDRAHGLDNPIAFFGDESYNRCRGASIAVFDGRLFVGFPDDKEQVSIGEIKLDDNRHPTEFRLLGTAPNTGTNTFPVLFATRYSMHMAWVASTSPPYLGMCDVQIPSP